jgi:hypothetical protein
VFRQLGIKSNTILSKGMHIAFCVVGTFLPVSDHEGVSLTGVFLSNVISVEIFLAEYRLLADPEKYVWCL